MSSEIKMVLKDLEDKLIEECNLSGWYQKKFKESEEKIIKYKIMIDEVKEIMRLKS